MPVRKIDFFLCGMQKSGTTALYRMLKGHPTIEWPTKKETHFFDNEGLDWREPVDPHFHSYFNWDNPDAIRGDATPIYTYWPNSLERIRAYNPGAKLIILLRHPAHRAYSHWKMTKVRGNESLTFSEAVSEKGRSRIHQASERFHREFSYVERGFYANQIEKAFELFSRSQVLLLLTDDLWRRPADILRDVEKFLSSPYAEDTSIGQKLVTPIKTDIKDQISPDALERLVEIYRDDIYSLESLTGLPVLEWLSGEYREAQYVDGQDDYLWLPV